MSAARKICQNVLRWYIYLLVLLLPFKFSSYINGGEQANFPLTIDEWLIFSTWPPILLPLLCAIPLLGTAILHPFPRFSRRLAVPALAILTFLAGLVGLIRTTEYYYAASWLWHTANLVCLGAAVAWLSEYDRRLLPGLLNVISIGALAALLQGWHQHFWGLQSKYEMMVQNAEMRGIPLTASMKAKLLQVRIYGNFSDPNTYAAHLLLTFPLLLYSLNSWSARVEPRRLSRPLFLAFGIILFVGAIFWSGSRGALVGLAAGLAAAIWLCPLKPKVRIGLVVLGVLAAAGLLVAVNYTSSRDLLSASVRLQYYQTSCRIFQKFPLTGAGLGEFFPWHMRLKPVISEDARDAHSMFFSLLGQCGLFGGLVALCKILLPMAMILGLWRRHRQNDAPLAMAALSGWFAWTCHAQMQFNDLIPSTCLIASFIGLYAFQDSPETTDADARKSIPAHLARAAAILAALLCFAVLGQFPVEIGIQRAEKLLGTYQSAAPSGPYAIQAATTLLEKCVRKSKCTPVPPIMLGELLASQNQFERAVDAYKELVRRTPHRVASHCRLAGQLLMANHPDEARACLASSAQWQPTNPNALYLDTLARLVKEEGWPVTTILRRYELVGVHTQLAEDDEGLHVELLPMQPVAALLDDRLFAALNRHAGTVADRPFTFRLASVDIRSGQVFSEEQP